MPTIHRTSTSTEYTQALAAGLASTLGGGDLLRFEGELGSGKTTFIRGLAQALGVQRGLVNSPTFVLVNEYPLPAERNGIRRLVHVDAYRLTSGDDLDALGWDRYITPSGRPQSDCVILIEWPSRIAEALASPASAITVRLAHLEEASRAIEIELPDSLASRPGLIELIEREPTRCPISRAWVEPTRPSYPFAGEREKLADLNKWFTGAYSIGRRATEADFDELPDQPPHPPTPPHPSHPPHRPDSESGPSGSLR